MRAAAPVSIRKCDPTAPVAGRIRIHDKLNEGSERANDLRAAPTAPMSEVANKLPPSTFSAKPAPSPQFTAGLMRAPKRCGGGGRAGAAAGAAASLRFLLVLTVRTTVEEETAAVVDEAVAVVEAAPVRSDGEAPSVLPPKLSAADPARTLPLGAGEPFCPCAR